MPDNNRPAAKPEPTVEPGEFEFDTPVTENPRLKRRSLKVRPSAPAPLPGDMVREAPPLSAEKARPEPKPGPLDDDDKNADVVFTDPASSPSVPSTAKPSRPHYASTVRPTSPSASPAPTQGDRPSTLYYSTGPRKDKEEPAPMKSTPTASPSPSPTTSPGIPRTAASSIRPATVVDYRTNMERQAREQKSIGGLLAIIVYVLIGFFVLGSSLAGYGIYALSKQVQKQSLTIDELDRHYAAQNRALTEQLKSTMDTLAQAQAQIGRQQELILKQQDAINKLLTAGDATAASLRQERLIRADETSALRGRVRDLENRTTQRY